MLAWISPQRALVRSYHDEQAQQIDLQTGWETPLPADSCSNLPQDSEIHRSVSYPSPDGRWLLHFEVDNRTYNGGDTDAPTRYLARLRLVSLTGAPSRLIPDSGAFTLRDIDNLVWMPDSRGWVVMGCDPSERLSLIRYRLDAPRRAQPLSVSHRVHYRSVERRRSFMARVTRQEELVLDDPQDAKRFYFVPLVAGHQEHDVLIGSPLEKPLAAGPEQRAVEVSADGRFLLVSVPTLEGPLRTWINNLLKRRHGHDEIWRIPVKGTPQKVISCPQVVSFSLTPDGSLVYWSYDDTYQMRAYRTNID